MWTKRFTLWRFMLCALFAVSVLAATARGEEDNVPSESQCRPYIEKALKKGLESGDSETDSTEPNDSSEVSVDNDSKEAQSGEELDEAISKEDEAPSVEVDDKPYSPHKSGESLEAAPNTDSKEEENSKENAENDSKEEVREGADDGDSKEEATADDSTEQESQEQKEENDDSQDDEDSPNKDEEDDSKQNETDEEADSKSGEDDETAEENIENITDEAGESKETVEDVKEASQEAEQEAESQEKAESVENTEEGDTTEGVNEENQSDGSEEIGRGEEEDVEANESSEVGEEKVDETAHETESEEDEKSDPEGQIDTSAQEIDETLSAESDEQKTDNADESDGESEENADPSQEGGEETEEGDSTVEDTSEGEEEDEGAPEEDLLLVPEIPENLRSREHIHQILRLEEDTSEDELTVERSADIVLRDLKRLYEGSIKPLEGIYKYRDLSNRHFGDPEIFSKPLVLFMGPWSGGKSSMLNYLTGLEFTEWSLRTGAEPSPAYFNILMHGKEPAVLDGTQLAADWTFSGLQKFGQGLEERLRGLKYPSKLLEKVNIVEIPGILEVRKQVSRVFPFNDACQWFIDRADIIFLVYDPSKLDVGPETEAILDQLKGRESQTRILLNKADTVKPEELLRVQSALIWNISPLMSSAQPPVMYTASLWSMPYESGAPVRLLQAQERELLRDLRHAIDKRIENKISSARRFAVRVRNHAKMVDCYLTTYFNHKTIFGNKKVIADAIIENPQNYHIYEGLSTLTNISRYDLPDPETYRDFFRLNPLYEFQQLSATCTYFRGCPINQLDIAIAYDLPELVGRYKKMVETATPQGMPKS